MRDKLKSIKLIEDELYTSNFEICFLTKLNHLVSMS